jgi:hypothetical protein
MKGMTIIVKKTTQFDFRAGVSLWHYVIIHVILLPEEVLREE